MTDSYRYTADGSLFRQSLLAFAVLAVVEVPVLGFLVHLIVQGPVAIALETVIGALTLALLLALASPLFTRHRVDSGTLHVRYGLLVAADVPLADVASVREVRRPVGFLQPLGAVVEGERAQVAFSESGQVELVLTRPCRLRAGWTAARVRCLTVNVDEPERLMIAVRSAHG